MTGRPRVRGRAPEVRPPDHSSYESAYGPTGTPTPLYDTDRIAEMSNCSRTFSLTMAPPVLRRWL